MENPFAVSLVMAIWSGHFEVVYFKHGGDGSGGMCAWQQPLCVRQPSSRVACYATCAALNTVLTVGRVAEA